MTEKPDEINQDLQTKVDELQAECHRLTGKVIGLECS
jgi:hypothetical protein